MDRKVHRPREGGDETKVSSPVLRHACGEIHNPRPPDSWIAPPLVNKPGREVRAAIPVLIPNEPVVDETPRRTVGVVLPTIVKAMALESTILTEHPR